MVAYQLGRCLRYILYFTIVLTMTGKMSNHQGGSPVEKQEMK